MNPGTGGVIHRRAPGLTEELHFACGREFIERALHGALAGAEGDRQGRTGPRLTVGKEGEDRSMLFFDGAG